MGMEEGVKQVHWSFLQSESMLPIVPLYPASQKYSLTRQNLVSMVY